MGEPPVRRRRAVDVVTLVAAAIVLLGCTAAASAPLSQAEIKVFRAVNDLPQSLYPFIWPLMQYGTFITIPALCIVALVLRRYRLAAVMALAGGGVYLLAKVVKLALERPRPGALLSDVNAREVFAEGSLGFPSGHAAVAAALVLACAAGLGVWWFRASLLLAAVVPIGRIYVGAHLLLDVVGGAALGVVAACGALLLLGAPGRRGSASSATEGRLGPVAADSSVPEP
jgi:glycosyltransferase 2 family protein